MLRAINSLLVILVFVLGMIPPASNAAMSHRMPDMAVSALDGHSMPAGCDACSDDPAFQVPCAKVFCAGAVMILAHADPVPEAMAAPFAPASDQDGSGIFRLLDPDPPRTIAIG